MTDPVSEPPHHEDADMDMSDDSSYCCSMDESESGSDDDSLSVFSLEDDSFLAEDARTVVPVPSPLQELIDSLHSNCEDLTSMELCVPIPEECQFQKLVQALRHNTTLVECHLSTECYKSLSPCHRRELALAICELPHLRCLTLDSVFPEFLYACNYCRCWKRDQYFRQHARYSEFENRTIQELRITHIPFDIAENLLGHLVMMTVFNFAALERIDMTFTNAFVSPQAVLIRVALTALSYSNTLKDVKFGHQDDLGDYNFTMEIDTTRNENIMRVLKLRCDGDQLSERSYVELAHMLRINNRTLRGLVLDTAVDNVGAMTIANTLGQNSNLKALCLGTFDCHDKTKRGGLLALIYRVLSPVFIDGRLGPSSLEYLSLVCQEMDDQGVEQIAKAFGDSSLRELMLFLDNKMEQTVSSQGISSLARVLQVNETVEEFSLICHSLDDDALLSFANALNTNTGVLKTLKLQCSKGLNVSAKGYQAVLDMLQKNTTLESFELSRCVGAEDDDDGFIVCEASEAAHLKYLPEIEFYLNLNKSGVRNLQLNIDTSPVQFRTMLASQSSDLNTLYYMLSTNPSFIPIVV